MSLIKTYEQWDVDNGKVWITGVPSGESFNLDIDIFDDIYATGVLKYNTEYISTGFFTFEDKDVEKIKRMIAWSKEYFSDSVREYDIDKNNFKDFDNLLDAVKDIKSHITIVAKGSVLMFISGLYRIYLIITDTGLYQLKIMKSGQTIDEYVIPVASAAPSRIKEEATKYFNEKKSDVEYSMRPEFNKDLNIPKDKDITFRLARQKTGGHLFIIEKVVDNKVIVFNGFQHFNGLKEFDLYPKIGEFDEVYIFDKNQKYSGGSFVNKQREWKIYRYKELPRIIKDMLIK